MEHVSSIAFVPHECSAGVHITFMKSKLSAVSALFSLFLVSALLAGCATTRGANETDASFTEAETRRNDPFEPFNRTMYSFNEKLDRYVLRPVASGYRTVVPAPARRGVTNFFSNLREPIVLVNNVLQGKFTHAASDLGRFLTNSTIGVFGLFDVATSFGLVRHNEDLGQTLGAWGAGEGPYLVLPFLGPSNIRDGIGLFGDLQLYPPYYLNNESTAWQLYGLEAVDTRARFLEAGDILEQAAGEDPYVFVREAYRQRRQGQIGDGSGSSEPAPLDPSIFEDDVPAAPASREPDPEPVKNP
jgi:phospholipid-binding lipoprotein MlaA